MPIAITVKTTHRTDMLDITSSVQKEVSNTGIQDGVCAVYVPHTTAGITINEGADPEVCEDIMSKLNDLVPSQRGYRHTEGNADSHIKASLIGNSVSVLVENGRLVLGTWQKGYGIIQAQQSLDRIPSSEAIPLSRDGAAGNSSANPQGRASQNNS
jgi:secondary thiamine-phosphate synthase enzyme